MKTLKEEKKRYYAVNPDNGDYYRTLSEVKKDLINYIPFNQNSLPYDERVIVYRLNGQDVSDLISEDIVFEFYDNKLHYPNGRVVAYKAAEESLYDLIKEALEDYLYGAGDLDE